MPAVALLCTIRVCSPQYENVPRILVVCNLPSPNTRKLFEAVVMGARNPEAGNAQVRALEPLQAGPADVLWCDGILLGTTENFGYMSGLIKDFLERIYYPCLEETEGKPLGFWIKGGLDGQGAKTSVERIVTGLRWRFIQHPLVLKGEFQEAWLEDCEHLGMTMAAGLDAGVY